MQATLLSTRSVRVEGLEFSCSYSLRYRGSLKVSPTTSSVQCRPDSAEVRGLAEQVFVIGDKQVTVEHWVKEGKDAIRSTTVDDCKDIYHADTYLVID